MFEKYIDNSKEEIIKQTCNLINIPSVHSEDDSGTPFGKSANEVLEYILALGESLGFRTKNIDGYCGYIEFGEGDELVGIIGHLDVVPEGDGWKHKPFSATIDDGKIFGRGAIDDKGPVIASLYAMKAVMDTAKVNKRVRLILGLNEERDWKCINYYKTHEEWPTIGFSPDADFPCIYAEKAIETIYLKMNYSKYLQDAIIITNIDCNNNAINVVPKFCSVDLKIDDSKINKQEFLEYLQNISKNHEIDIKIKENENNINIETNGISAHATHPDLGINAISRMLIILQDIFKQYNIHLEIFELFTKYIGMEYNGKRLGIDLEDESGKLTLNAGKFSLDDNEIKIGMNLRIPVNTQFQVIEDRFEDISKDYKNIEIIATDKKEALYISKENHLVKTLCNIFNKMTGRNDEPIAIGGATYARAFENCISFGANMPGHKDMCHQVDEYIEIDTLIMASKIYAEAIYELTK